MEFGLDKSEVIREFADSLETNPTILKERIIHSKLITKLNEDRLKQIEDKEKLKEQEQQYKEFDKIQEQENERFEDEARKQTQIILNKLIDKFSKDPDNISFNIKDKRKIDKFIENKTKKFDKKMKEHIAKRLNNNIKRYIGGS